MAREKFRLEQFKSRDGRKALKLKVRTKPYWIWLAPGISVGYCACKGPGRWAWRDAAGQVKRFALADDNRDDAADGVNVMTADQAADYTKAKLRGELEASTNVEAMTLGYCVDVHYRAHLRARRKFEGNARTIFNHIKRVAPGLLERDVRVITKVELDKLRNALLAGNGVKKGLINATWNRVAKSLAAALRQVVKHRDDIYEALEPLPEERDNEEAAENVVLTDEEVGKLLTAAYAESWRLGVWIHALEGTGNRPSQVARLRIRDLHDSPEGPFLAMLKSGKGGGKRQRERMRDQFPVPITEGLAQQLRAASEGRDPAEYLFINEDGKPYAKGRTPYEMYAAAWKRIRKVAGIPAERDGKRVGSYCLRHTSITRMLLAEPIIQPRIVAAHHDTSVGELEAHYSVAILKQQAAGTKVRAVLRDRGLVVIMKNEKKKSAA